MSKIPLSILVVEDNPDDLFILKRAFKMAGTTNRLEYAEDGQKAIDYLQGIAPSPDQPAQSLPSLILLDLKLPNKNGFEVLSWIKQQPALARIVVLILTSSSEDKDVCRAYDLGANAFLVKPTSTETLTEIVRALDIFWLRHNTYRLMPLNA